MAKNVFIFADKDMDGAGCVLATVWSLPNVNIKFISAGEYNFREVFTKWWADAETHNTTDQVFVCDLNVAADHADILDYDKVCIVDHHVYSNDVKHLYKRAHLFCDKLASSSTRLMCTLLNNYSTFTWQQRKLIDLIDDNDSFTHLIPESRDLNTVFYSLQGDKVRAFVNQFKTGFNSFNLEQQNIIRFHKLKLQQTIDNVTPFKAELDLGGAKRVVFSAFADYGVNDVAQHLIKNYGAEIAIIINLKNKTVSFRRSKTSNYDVSILSKQLVGGAGHEKAAGGVITDKLLAFSKLFQPA